MKLGFRQIVALVLVLFMTMPAIAQQLPKMTSDPAVSTGVLPNGLTYYIASDSSEKGLADFALVQKTGLCNIPDTSASEGTAGTIARRALSSLVRLKGCSPSDFFGRHGSVPGKDGYVSVNENATIYRFPAVRLSDGKSVLDSALMIMMDIADRATFTDNAFQRKWYSSADQAVIIAGDVDSKALISRIEAMSYMIPAYPSLQRRDVYPQDSSVVSVVDLQGQMQELSMTWVSKRVPREYMNTVQPVIFNMALDVLGRVAVRRIGKSLKAAGIPYADVSCRHRNSEDGPWDDALTLSVSVHPDDLSRVKVLVTKVMNDIDSCGVSVDEYLLAEAGFMDVIGREAYPGQYKHSAMVQRCISAFLYNSHLASPSQIYAFHTSRQITDSVRCGFFNDMAAALLYPLGALPDSSETVTCPTTYPLNLPGSGTKVKLKSVRSDHLSGGSVWTFSNGFKVVYRHMPSAGDVYYTLALNGGYGSISGLAAGEGAFVSDIFRLSKIAGVDGDDFFDALKMDGLVMDPVVTLSNMLVSGHMPKDRMQLLLQSLLALANTREDMPESFPYYMKSVEASLDHPKNSSAARMTAIDSIMCPGYRYSPYKSKGSLTPSFYPKASAFVDAQMSKMNDGVLVIVGNIEEEPLKQMLQQYVGGFRTKDAPARRPAVRYQPVSGWSTYTVKGDEDVVEVAVSARMPLTSVNYLSACIAVLTVERDLSRTLAASGASFDILFNCRIYPEERMNMLISVSAADPQGLAEGVGKNSSIDGLGDVRNALSGLSHRDITDSELKQYKAYLKNRIQVEMKHPQYWVDAITVRYLDGKDLTSGYASNIDGLTRDDVKKIFNLMDKGCKVEYVTTR